MSQQQQQKKSFQKSTRSNTINIKPNQPPHQQQQKQQKQINHPESSSSSSLSYNTQQYNNKIQKIQTFQQLNILLKGVLKKLDFIIQYLTKKDQFTQQEKQAIGGRINKYNSIIKKLRQKQQYLRLQAQKNNNNKSSDNETSNLTTILTQSLINFNNNYHQIEQLISLLQKISQIQDNSIKYLSQKQLSKSNPNSQANQNQNQKQQLLDTKLKKYNSSNSSQNPNSSQNLNSNKQQNHQKTQLNHNIKELVKQLKSFKSLLRLQNLQNSRIQIENNILLNSIQTIKQKQPSQQIKQYQYQIQNLIQNIQQKQQISCLIQIDLSQLLSNEISKNNQKENQNQKKKKKQEFQNFIKQQKYLMDQNKSISIIEQKSNYQLMQYVEQQINFLEAFYPNNLNVLKKINNQNRYSIVFRFKQLNKISNKLIQQPQTKLVEQQYLISSFYQLNLSHLQFDMELFLSIEWQNVLSIKFKNCKLTQDNIIKLIQTADKFKNLEYLDLSENKLNQLAFKQFQKNVDKFGKLKIINFNYSQITSKQFNQLTQLSKKMKYLQQIHLTHNQINALKKRHLVRLNSNPQLKLINLKYNPLNCMSYENILYLFMQKNQINQIKYEIIADYNNIHQLGISFILFNQIGIKNINIYKSLFENLPKIVIQKEKRYNIMITLYTSKLTTLILDNLRFQTNDWNLLINNIWYFKELRKISLKNNQILFIAYANLEQLDKFTKKTSKSLQIRLDSKMSQNSYDQIIRFYESIEYKNSLLCIIIIGDQKINQQFHNKRIKFQRYKNQNRITLKIISLISQHIYKKLMDKQIIPQLVNIFQLIKYLMQNNIFNSQQLIKQIVRVFIYINNLYSIQAYNKKLYKMIKCFQNKIIQKVQEWNQLLNQNNYLKKPQIDVKINKNIIVIDQQRTKQFIQSHFKLFNDSTQINKSQIIQSNPDQNQKPCPICKKLQSKQNHPVKVQKNSFWSFDFSFQSIISYLQGKF